MTDNGRLASDLFDLQGRVAVVTGALGLLGRHHCRALAEAGANVVVTDLDAEGCEELAQDLETATGREALAHAAEVTDSEALRGLLDATLRRFDQLDVLVNNAAVNDSFSERDDPELARFERYPIESWQRSIDVNLTGVFLCCQVFGSSMAARRRGSIINVASTYGVVAPDQSIYARPDGTQSFWKSAAYPAVKAGVLGLTRYLASYWGRSGVRVNALSPGGVEDGQDEYFIRQYSARTPLGRMAEPSEYRGALLFLASDASSYMTGANLVVDGGWTTW
jgi:NAD(P)-dependent dehydrogenase (short-subunit alcohol dehydrogenase family)